MRWLELQICLTYLFAASSGGAAAEEKEEEEGKEEEKKEEEEGEEEQGGEGGRCVVDSEECGWWIFRGFRLRQDDSNCNRKSGQSLDVAWASGPNSKQEQGKDYFVCHLNHHSKLPITEVLKESWICSQYQWRFHPCRAEPPRCWYVRDSYERGPAKVAREALYGRIVKGMDIGGLRWYFKFCFSCEMKFPWNLREVAADQGRGHRFAQSFCHWHSFVSEQSLVLLT